MRKSKGIFDILEVLCIGLMVLALAGMVVFISYQVFSRYVLNSPLPWTEELSRHLMIWAAFVGSAVAFRRRGHMGIDVFPLWLRSRSERGARLLDIGVSVGVLILAVYVTLRGIGMASRTWLQFSAALRIRMTYIYAAVPTGFIFIALFSVERLMSILMHVPGTNEVGHVPEGANSGRKET